MKELRIHSHVFFLIALMFCGLMFCYVKLNKIQRDLEHVVILMEEGICE